MLTIFAVAAVVAVIAVSVIFMVGPEWVWRFFTVLGPEANDAHKNHFHLDMKERRSGFCQ
jgi:hypothetical protein